VRPELAGSARDSTRAQTAATSGQTMDARRRSFTKSYRPPYASRAFSMLRSSFLLGPAVNSVFVWLADQPR
jgi:hypothetical protein